MKVEDYMSKQVPFDEAVRRAITLRSAVEQMSECEDWIMYVANPMPENEFRDFYVKHYEKGTISTRIDLMPDDTMFIGSVQYPGSKDEMTIRADLEEQLSECLTDSAVRLAVINKLMSEYTIVPHLR